MSRRSLKKLAHRTTRVEVRGQKRRYLSLMSVRLSGSQQKYNQVYFNHLAPEPEPEAQRISRQPHCQLRAAAAAQSLRALLTAAEDQIFETCQLLRPDGAARVHFSGGNTNFGAHAKLTPVRKLR